MLVFCCKITKRCAIVGHVKKLEPHTDLVLRLFRETKTYSGAHKALGEHGISVTYETVRSFLEKLPAAKSLPKRRKGRPKTSVAASLGILDQNTDPSQSAGEIPLVLMAILDCPLDLRRQILIETLNKAGMMRVGDTTGGDMALSCERASRLSDLELLYVTFLASDEQSPVGLDEPRFQEWLLVLMQLARRAKERIKEGGGITLEQLQEAMYNNRNGMGASE